jgi:hypothetical protein
MQIGPPAPIVNRTSAAVGETPSFEYDARVFGLDRGNTAAQNATLLQAAIDAGGLNGGVIYVREMYPCDPVILRHGVALANDGPMPFKGHYQRGTDDLPLEVETPANGGFTITDDDTSFLRVEGHCAVRNLQFQYPNQNYATTTLAGAIEYPPTISQADARIRNTELYGLSFIGSHSCIDFNGTECSDLFVDLCYGYPLGGRFLRLVNNLDIARITRCHVNPVQGIWVTPVQPGGVLSYKYAMLDAIVAGGDPAFEVTTADELIISQCFLFAGNTGFRISNTYGSVVQCSADMVETGLHYTPGSAHKSLAVTNFNCIPSAGPTPANRSAFKYDGAAGQLSLEQCRGFLGVNDVIPSSSSPEAGRFLLVSGTGAQRVDMGKCFKSATTGSWATGVEVTNASATVSAFGGNI